MADRRQLPRWWAEERWWCLSDYFFPDVIPPLEADRLAGFAAETIDRGTWERFCEGLGQSDLLSLLVAKGLLPLTTIAQFGAVIEAVGSLRGYPRLLSGLRSVKDTDSTYLEAQTASVLVRCRGASVSFPAVGKQPTPDIHVEMGGQTFSVECKRLQPEKWERWVRELTSEVISRTWSDRPVQVQLHSRISELNFDSADALNEAVIRGIAGVASEGIQEALRAPPNELRRVSVAGIAEVIAHPVGASEHNAVSGPEISEVAVTKRAFQKGVLEASEQVLPGTLGIAVVQCPHRPDPVLARVLFDATRSCGQKGADKLVGVVLLARQYLGPRQQGYILSAERITPEAREVLRTLKEGFDLIEA